MNRNELNKIMPIMEAFLGGQDVQYYSRDNGWITANDPDFNPHYEWRIKPEVKVIYFDVKNNVYHQEMPMDGTEVYTYIKKDYIISFIAILKATCNPTTVNFINEKWEELQKKLEYRD